MMIIHLPRLLTIEAHQVSMVDQIVSSKQQLHTHGYVRRVFMKVVRCAQFLPQPEIKCHRWVCTDLTVDQSWWKAGFAVETSMSMTLLPFMSHWRVPDNRDFRLKRDL